MKFFKDFSKVKILVVGDVMIDKYLWGEVSRISPEAPVPVVKLKKTSLTAGGAADVAVNVAGLGAEPFLVGVVGGDYEAETFPAILNDSNVSPDFLFKIRNRQTTIKTRVIAHSQQVVRVDQEASEPPTVEDEEKIWQTIENLISNVSVVVISDYNKGLLSKNLLARLITHCRRENKIILVDPKGRDFQKYKGVSLLTPNKVEMAEACGIDVAGDGYERELFDAAANLMLSLRLEALPVTRGEQGMTLFENGGTEPKHLAARARQVYDVTGAGDTVIAALAVALGAGKSFAEAAEIANTAAGLVVQEVGTTAINIQKLEKAVEID